MSGPRHTTTYKQLMESNAPGMRVSYTTYNSVKLQTQRAAFLIKEFLCNNLADTAYDGGVKLTNPWTMHWSSDGTSGPSSDSDHTDRITDQTKFATRADSNSSAISYYVLRSGSRVREIWAANTEYAIGDVITDGSSLWICQTAGTSASSGGPSGTTSDSYVADGTVEWRYIGDGDGYLYLCVAFRTAQDYYLSITFSTKYKINTTSATYFPSASSNSAICIPSNTHQVWLTGSDASLDRILHITARDDGTGFWIAATRNADVPGNGGCIVLGRVPDEYADGFNATQTLALPVFLWVASASGLKSNNVNATTTILGYNTLYAVGGVLVAFHNGPNSHQGNAHDCAMMAPVCYGAATVFPVYSTDSFLTRRKWPLGLRYQSWPLTHIASTSNDFNAIIWGTVLDMHLGSPRNNTVGLLFGLRWWCYGMLLIPNPSQLEPTVV